MSDLFPTILLTGVLSSVAAALLAGLVLVRLGGRRNRLRDALIGLEESDPAFVFDGERLLDANDAGYRLFPDGRDEDGPLSRLVELLAPAFPGLAQSISHLPERQNIAEPGRNGMAEVQAEWIEGLTRLRIRGGSIAHTGDADRTRTGSPESELATLRGIAHALPCLVWKQDAEGRVQWANRAYLDFAEKINPPGTLDRWPIPRLFNSVAFAQPAPGARARRAAIRSPALPAERWFEVWSAQVGDEILYTAVDADGIVRAETSLREFIQTLSKTFAHLTVGLAVFDKKRRLALFNPALVDLTQASAEFLSGRPTLHSFLDRLREARTIPEPRNYAAWRQQIVDLEVRAESGTYEEIWSLPTGQTYRVTGRPHPEKAVAFLFEDISAEVSLTRKFRAELELGQSVLDCVTEAIGVFSTSGFMTLANAQYVRLWGHDPASTLGSVSISEASAIWQAATRPSPLWGEVRNLVRSYGEREAFDGRVRMTDGKELFVRAVPLGGGSCLVGFSGEAVEAAGSAPVGDPETVTLSG